MQPRELELKSSAVTLSDMEMFIFPELIYALTLANIMSPVIWQWKDDPWFSGLEKMTPYRRILRLKQFIMDHFAFNLDLDTWGLTTKQAEIDRFNSFIDIETLRQSNALFGYEGDRYYFDIDIRSHFGLDKYDSDIIPYWKTETVEAMQAFQYRPDYAAGAGECVSLAALYAAALYVVAEIPLESIYMMATPLHSQNFVDIEGGILTNNRRLVTQTMWFNGTALSAQARRALENERVTIVAHATGCIQTIYDEASIDPAAYGRFEEGLRRYLQTPITTDILANFLRQSSKSQCCFQVRCRCGGHELFVPLERLFAYEHGSPHKVNPAQREKLLAEVETQEFTQSPLANRIILNDLEDFLAENHINPENPADLARLEEQFTCGCINLREQAQALINFSRIEPRTPEAASKTFKPYARQLDLKPGMNRAEVIARLEDLRESNPMAELAFYAYRDLNRTDTEPFIKAALERNPVSLAGFTEQGLDEIIEKVTGWPNESIYDEPGRLAQPDEVFNFGRGDGVEKAVLIANVARSRGLDARIEIDPAQAKLILDQNEHSFASSKALKAQTWTV